MSLEGDGSSSVPPPGFAASTAPAAVGSRAGVSPLAQVAPSTVATAAPLSIGSADAAVRWRIGAATIDNFVVYGGYLLLCLLLQWRPASLSHLWLLLVGGVLYHFYFEARAGQTPGKRRYGIRVVGLDGGAASPKAVAIRSVARIIDQLPVAYVSGLISMVRTGPARRQRLGDVAAGTMVVAVEGRALAKGTPGWLLPSATIVATLLSALTAVAIATAGDHPFTDSQRAQFIAGCERGGPSASQCGCVLTQLEAAGYNTPNALRDLLVTVRSDTLAGRSTAARTAVIDAAMSCRGQ